ncbi:hypothetical protein [Flavisolibacter tropicus]|uniref:Stationary phase survival protein SurE n=1 Tax=Flavisolibacter tropicus TaxID=1492898 RepID=A0A172TUZ7_9BACT|nr:hypothetical protein [Flavisolibacter tropicus]ANE50603.1 hypothetical protein SY85_08900 [Flavisolibacter tropicus]
MKKTGTFFLAKDKLPLGIILALLVPFAVFLFIYFLRFSYYDFTEFLGVVKTESRLLTFLAAWCLVANIGLFTIYINSGKYQTAKGVFGITVFYGIVFLLLKMIL